MLYLGLKALSYVLKVFCNFHRNKPTYRPAVPTTDEEDESVLVSCVSVDLSELPIGQRNSGGFIDSIAIRIVCPGYGQDGAKTIMST